MEKIPYCKAVVGCIMYSMIATRLDVVIVVGVVNQFMQNPSYAHWRVVKQIKWYLQDTYEYQLQLTRTTMGNEVILTSYYDSNWGGDLDSRKSTIGYTFILGSTIGTISDNLL